MRRQIETNRYIRPFITHAPDCAPRTEARIRDCRLAKIVRQDALQQFFEGWGMEACVTLRGTRLHLRDEDDDERNKSHERVMS
jgi:hypothetical protein